MKFARIIISLAVFIIFLGAGTFAFYRIEQRAIPLVDESPVPQPPIKDQRVFIVDRIAGGFLNIPVEVARTEEEVSRGLSFRPTLPEDQGMLFIFPTPEIQTFWMPGMQFPLDIIFIREGRIVEIRPNIPPPAATNGIPAIVRSRAAADGVLEINAGKAEEWGLNPGMEVTTRQK